MKKQPLIMSNESLEDDGEQTTKLSKERQSRTNNMYKSFLLGSSNGFALQVVSFAACYTTHFKKNPRSFSYSMLVLISWLNLAIFVVIWLTTMYAITRSGSLYMRKTFDEDAAANNPNEKKSDAGSCSMIICTTTRRRRMLFTLGIYFLFGASVGSFSLWMIVALRMRMVITLMPFCNIMMIDVVAFLITVKFFDWTSRSSGCTTTVQEELLEDDDSSFVV